MTKLFKQALVFWSESFTLNEIYTGIRKICLPTAAVKEDTNMFSSESREGFGFLLWLPYTIKLLLTNWFGP